MRCQWLKAIGVLVQASETLGAHYQTRRARALPSPIDLIPIFGYLDDIIIIIALRIMLAVYLIPETVVAEHRATAARTQGKPISRAAAVAISWRE